MEFSQEFVIQLKLWVPRILGMSVALGLLAWWMAARLPQTHTVHFSYLVALSEREEVNEFRFDGYYALQATDLFATTLAQWIQAPEVVAAAYERMGVRLPSQEAFVVTRSISAEKKASQLVSVSVEHAQEEIARRLAQGIREEITERVEQYHDQGVPQLSFSVVADEPWVSVEQVKAWIVGWAVGLVLFFVGINMLLLILTIRSQNGKV